MVKRRRVIRCVLVASLIAYVAVYAVWSRVASRGHVK